MPSKEGRGLRACSDSFRQPIKRDGFTRSRDGTGFRNGLARRQRPLVRLLYSASPVAPIPLVAFFLATSLPGLCGCDNLLFCNDFQCNCRSPAVSLPLPLPQAAERAWSLCRSDPSRPSPPLAMRARHGGQACVAFFSCASQETRNTYEG